MTLKSIAPDELPEKATRQRKSTFTDEQIADAIKQLKAGNAILPDQTFKTEGAARRAALLLKHHIEDSAEFGNGLQPSTRVWSDGEAFKCAVLLRERKPTKAARI